MIIVDTSAVIAVLEGEGDAAFYAGAMSSAEDLAISALNAHEAAVVMRTRRGPLGEAAFWTFLSSNEIEIVPFDADQAKAAAAAYGRYGKGLHPQARLNLADCAAYTLAKARGAPLLFKGNDFTGTDVERWG